MNLTALRVKEVLGRGGATLEELCERLDIPEADYLGRDQVRKILRDLEIFRQIRTLPGGGRRFYYLSRKPGARGEVQEKLWRFMVLRYGKGQGFTVGEAAARAEADRDYAKRYSHFCREQGFIRPVGRRGNATVYQVVPGREGEAAPRWNRRAEKRGKQGSGVRGQGPGARGQGSGATEILAEMRRVLEGLAAGAGRAVELWDEIVGGVPGGGDGAAGPD